MYHATPARLCAGPRDDRDLVEDDGEGMDADALALSIERHATSKLASELEKRVDLKTLKVTEKGSTETPVEMDNWQRGAEWAEVVLTPPDVLVGDRATIDLGDRMVELAHLGEGAIGLLAHQREHVGEPVDREMEADLAEEKCRRHRLERVARGDRQ